jgi:hypothetical protein
VSVPPNILEADTYAMQSLLLVLSTFDSITHLIRARRMQFNEDFEKKYNDSRMSTQDNLVRKGASSQMLEKSTTGMRTESRLNSIRFDSMRNES